MFFIELDNLDTVNNLTNLCNKYKDYTDVDVKYGRYTVNGVSVLAVTSLLGNIVTIETTSKDELFKTFFFGELKSIGGWKDEA